MFDLRYHVASLAAVFLMLVVGILIGVGISGRGFVDDAERDRFNDRIAGLQERGGRRERDRGRLRAAAAGGAGLRRERLSRPGREAAWRGRTVAVAVLGSVEQGSFRFVERAIAETPTAGSRGCGR